MEAVLFTDFIKLEAKPWQNVAEVHSLVSAACRLKFREIVETVTISKDCVSEILGKRKPSEGWGARFLTQKPWDHFSQLSCIWWCCLSAIRRSLTKVTPKSKKRLRQWISPDQSARNKAKFVVLTGKEMATVFWDSEGLWSTTTYRRTKRSEVFTMSNYCTSPFY